MSIARQIPIAFVIGIVAIGFTPKVQAQSKFPNSPNSGAFTLSGESLGDINSRTTSEDYGNFFSGNAPIFRDDNADDSQGPPTFSLEEEYGIIFGDTVTYPDYVEQFRSPGDTNSSQSIKFKIPVEGSLQE